MDDEHEEQTSRRGDEDDVDALDVGSVRQRGHGLGEQ